VAAEFAIVKIRVSQLEIRAKRGNHFAKLAKQIVEHLDSYLAATQLGITLASLGLGWIGEPVVSKLIINVMNSIGVKISEELAHDIALPVAFAIITILHIVFGELAPKSIAIQRSEKTTLAIAYPLRFFYIVFKPFIWVLNGISNFLLKLLGVSATHGIEVHSAEELKHLVQQGKESGVVGAGDYNIINNAFNFSDRVARQIMIPRTQMIAVDVNDFDDSTLKTIIDEGYSRLPCYEESIDNILGVVYLKEILLKLRESETIDIRSLLHPVIIVPETKRIGLLLKDFQSKHQQIAIVVDEYGAVAGMVTLEDILEELVGEIQDESDDEKPVVQKTGDGIYIVQANASLHDINNLLPFGLERTGDYETLAGKLIHRFGRIPEEKEKIILDRYEITVFKKTQTSIMLVELKELQ
jgi:CBS domain containing-hemolysin-like protein